MKLFANSIVTFKAGYNWSYTNSPHTLTDIPLKLKVIVVIQARQLLALLFVLSAVWIFAPGATACAQDSAETEAAPFSVHEWGVFTVPRNADWLKQDMLREWMGFPEFFQGVLPERELLYRGPVTKPVMFFHGEAQQPIGLAIQFATGQPLIWWPPVEHPAQGTFGNYLPEYLSGVPPESVIRYQMNLNQDTGTRNEVPEGHWVQALRRVDAAPLSVQNTYSMKRAVAENISEDFIYYDGLMQPPKPPVVARTESGIALSTDSAHPWLDVIVIDRRIATGDLLLGRWDRIESGNQQTQIELQPADQATLVQWEELFRTSLQDAGLHDDEAQSLLDVWATGLFDRFGLTVFYRIPQSTYDEWIPLHFQPEPENLVRVGLVVHYHLEPELDQIVGQLLDDLGADNYATRADADRYLHSIGGAAFPAIRQAAVSEDREQAARARRLLQSLDNDELLREVMSRYEESDD
ncbi:MAG: hypothetical protein ACR2NP_15630 [Pirellulaceae bacterium]